MMNECWTLTRHARTGQGTGQNAYLGELWVGGSFGLGELWVGEVCLA